MILLKRSKPLNLLIRESLYYRTELDDLSTKEYLKQVNGFKGEQEFDSFFQDLSYEHLALQDLLLDNGSQLVQIDTLLLTARTLYLYEIKNYSVDYTYKEDGLYAQSDFIIANPLIQLQKNRVFIYNLIRKLGYRVDVKAYIVYNHLDSYLYELPRDKPILFKHQLSSHFSQLNRKMIPLTSKDKRLMSKLADSHLSDYRSERLPKYCYEDLKKGTRCFKCGSLSHIRTRQFQICECGYEETIKEAIMRNIEEFRSLFPEINVTTEIVKDWCGHAYSHQRIQRLLRENFEAVGSNRYRYYE